MQRPYLMQAGMQDTEEVVIIAGEDQCALIAKNTRRLPNEDPVLCVCGRNDVPLKGTNCLSHRGSWLPIKPPFQAVALSIVAASFRVHFGLHIFKRHFILLCLFQCSAGAKVNCPNVAVVSHKVNRTDNRPHNIGIRAAINVQGSCEHSVGCVAVNIK